MNQRGAYLYLALATTVAMATPACATEMDAVLLPASAGVPQVEIARPDEARLRRWMEQCSAGPTTRKTATGTENCAMFPGLAAYPFPAAYPVPAGYRVVGYDLVTVSLGLRPGPPACCEVVTVSEITIEDGEPVPEGYVDAPVDDGAPPPS
ncbi:hypothetical protein [Novosphingobium percolationis]|uniref:hypothetical protein n=1 Tax=Novosphingobium percolationis TaxID=2871811 RepID=UPI001CD2EDE1|nr:hypothetical protein [Novosphingobium percolationis]